MTSGPVFVVGTPRSGTTLTANILGRHSRIFMAGENHFFEDVYSRRDQLGDPVNPDARDRIIERLSTIYGRYNQPGDQRRVDRLLGEPAATAALNGADTYRDLLSTFMEIQAGTGVRWGNNTPKDIFHIEEILSLYPDVCVVVCVRDVRDFLLSYKNRWRTTTPDNRERFKDLYHPVLTSLVWRATVSRIPTVMAAIGESRCLLVRYEDLVSDTEAVVRRLCAAIGEEFEQNMLAVDSHNSSRESAEAGVFTSSVGRWREQLEPEDARVARQLTRRHLESLGYDVQEPIVASKAKVLRCWISTPVALVRSLRANEGRRGPLVPYLVKRVRALVGSAAG